jgi:hypothetical protein
MRRARGPVARGRAEELSAAFPGAELLGKLIPTRLSVLLVLRLIDRSRLLDDLARDRGEVERRLAARVPGHPRPIERDHARPDQPSLRTQPEHLAEQLGQRRLMPFHEPGDRRVIRRLEHRNRLERNVLLTRPLDLPRGADPARVPVEQQGNQAIIAGSYARRPTPSARYAP